MWIWLLIGTLVGAFLAWLILRYKLKLDFERWKLEWEERVRQEALERSRAVLRGKISEQLAPLLPNFPFDPADARFIGNPIDYVVFDGYSKLRNGGKGELSIVLLDVKQGSSELSREQRAIKEAVEAKRVKWLTLRP